ncbi:trehalose-phosphatase [Algicella marina]|nr:trehalose-phosphatase [Algicella marina]
MRPPLVSLATHAICLDFDGTLVDIAATPDGIEVPETLAPLLNHLLAETDGATALISGRDVAALRRHLPEYKGPIIGSHGGERSDAPGRIDTSGLPDARAVIAEVHALAAGLRVEEKPHGAVLHYRAEPDRADEAETTARAIAARFPGFTLQRAKMAWEIHPEGISKDRALATLFESPPFQGRLPLFAGDDTTDEPALAHVAQKGGIAIRIGGGDSAAPYHLETPSDMLSWLASLS